MVLDIVSKILESFILTPLSWLPEWCLAFVLIAIRIFGLFVLGRILKWVWDALPIA